MEKTEEAAKKKKKKLVIFEPSNMIFAEGDVTHGFFQSCLSYKQ